MLRTARLSVVSPVFLVVLIILAAAGGGTAATKATVSVDGVATLDGESDHSGIRVLFEADSPSAVTDSVFTDAAGTYAIDVELGVYDVTFSKTGYLPGELLNQYLLSTTTLDPVSLAPETMVLSGDLNGTLSGPATYYIGGEIAVQNGDTLVIEPGVRLEFMGYYALTVSGLLLAQGTEADSVVFTSGAVTPGVGDWSGLSLPNGADDNSVLEYCSVSFADIGIYPNNCFPMIGHCAFRDCNRGIFWTPSAGAVPTSYTTIADCLVERCYTVGITIGGGALAAAVERCTFRACDRGLLIYADATHDPGSVTDCVFEDSYGTSGTGIHCYDYFVGEISGCTFTGNERGIYIENRNAPVISRCLFVANQGGVFLADADAEIRHCTFADNSSYGVSFSNASAEAIVNSNVFTGSLWPIGGISSNAANSQIFFNCIDEGNPVNFPPGVGDLLFENANGDSCDIFYNIFLDPQLVDAAAGDVSLLETSPCIDAGDLISPLDPDGTIADIGAIYYNQIESAVPLPGAPRTLLVEQNAPNPFNPMTTIGFTLTRDARVDLRIFDVAGRLVRVLVAGEARSAGAWRENWDGHNDGGRAMASGVYFYRVGAGSEIETRRMTLVR